jgi:DNA-binding NarL/FixJ family response regulator
MVLGGVNHEMTEGSLREAVAACRLTHRQHIAQNINQLTDRQVELMELIEMGLRDSEICHELKVSKSAVAQRKRAICDCLGLTNFQTAAQIYTAQKWSGLIAP